MRRYLTGRPRLCGIPLGGLGWLPLALFMGPAAGVSAHPSLEDVGRAVERAVAQHPEDPEVHLREGDVQRLRGEWRAALAAYRKAAEHGADPSVVAAARGIVFLEAGRPRIARVELNRALARHPDRTRWLFARGHVWGELGRPDEAARDFKRAIAQMSHPTPDHIFRYRDALMSAGRPEEALRALDDGIGRIGHVASLELAAVDLELHLGRPGGALRRMDTLLEEHPRNEVWITRRGEILERAGRAKDARLAYASALELIQGRNGRRKGRRIRDLELRLRDKLGLQPNNKGREERP